MLPGEDGPQSDANRYSAAVDFSEIGESIHQTFLRKEALSTPASWLEKHGVAIPTVEQLARILDESFAASLLTNEGRPVCFVLSLLTTQSNEPHFADLRFEQSVPLDRDALRRIAPMAPPARAVIRVEPTETGELQIAGVQSFPDGSMRPRALSVGALRPGNLSISFGRHRIASIRGDKCILLNDELADRRLLVHLLSRYFKDYDHDTRLASAQLLLDAAVLIQNYAHGGALWVAQGGGDVPGLTMLRCSLRGEWNKRLGPELTAFGDGQRAQAQMRLISGLSALAHVEAMGAAAALAQLSAVDGAVLINMKPEVVGVEAFIHSEPPSAVWDATLPAGRAERASATSVGGGRHRSAVAFCHEGSRHEQRRGALVVSQDGTVSLFLAVTDSEDATIFGAPAGSVVRVKAASVGAGFASDSL